MTAVTLKRRDVPQATPVVSFVDKAENAPSTLSWWSQFQKGWEARSLNNSLKAAMSLAGEHQACGLQPGHAYFVQIQKKMSVETAAFRKRWNVSDDDLHLEYPLLTSLDELTVVKPSSSVMRSVIWLLILSPVICALSHVVVVHISRWLGA